MVTFALAGIISLYMLPVAALEYFHFKDKKAASDRLHTWVWTVGSMAAAHLLTELNSYLIQQGF